MTEKTGVARLRRAIDNQYSVGEGEFRLPFANITAICDEIEGGCTGASWAQGVPTPMDADGEVVPLTTVAMYDDDGKEVRVSRFSLTNDGFKQNRWTWSVRVMTGFIVNLEDLHIHRPDSWERLEGDVDRIRSDETDPDECYYFDEKGIECSECPAMGSGSCSRYIARDVMRRAKALAGKGED